MEDIVKKIIVEIIINRDGEAPNIEINESTKLREELGLDSFNLAELTVYLEDEFDVDVFEDGIVNTVGEIYDKLNGRN